MKPLEDHIDRRSVVEFGGNWSAREHCRRLTERGIPYDMACEMACYEPADDAEDQLRAYLKVVGVALVLIGIFAAVLYLI